MCIFNSNTDILSVIFQTPFITTVSTIPVKNGVNFTVNLG